MDPDDFLDEEVMSNVQRYEKMVRNKAKDYFDTDALESIIEYYINKNKLPKALDVISFAQELYPQYSQFNLKKAEALVLLGKFNDAIDEIEKVELYEPFNAELFLLKGETFLNMEEMESAGECFEKALLYHDD